MKRKLLHIPMGIACLSIFAIMQASAANKTWQNADPLDGNFSDSSRWNAPAAPGTDDIATFNGSLYPENSDFTVTLTASVTNQTLRVANATTVTLDLNGYTYETTSNTTGTTYFQSDTGGLATLRLTGGAVTLPIFEVARASGSQGRLELSGSTTTLTASADSYIGSSGSGTFEISDGAKFNTTGVLRFAHNSVASGSGLVTGTGSAITVTNNSIIIGNTGTASLTVEEGGSVKTTGGSGGVRFASSSGTATGLITGTGSILEGADVSIGGGTVKGGTANVEVADQGSLVARGTLRIFGDSELTVNNATVSSNTFTAFEDSAFSLVLSESDNTAFLSSTGDFTLEENVTLNLSLATGASFALNDTLNLVSYGGTLDGQFSGFSEGSILNVDGYQFQISYGTGANSFIGLTVVPEPQTTILLLIGAGLVACQFRKRKAK